MVKIFTIFIALLVAFLLNWDSIFIFFDLPYLIQVTCYFLIIGWCLHSAKLIISSTHLPHLLHYELTEMLPFLNGLYKVVYSNFMVDLDECYLIFEPSLIFGCHCLLISHAMMKMMINFSLIFFSLSNLSSLYLFILRGLHAFSIHLLLEPIFTVILLW